MVKDGVNYAREQGEWGLISEVRCNREKKEALGRRCRQLMSMTVIDFRRWIWFVNDQVADMHAEKKYLCSYCFGILRWLAVEIYARRRNVTTSLVEFQHQWSNRIITVMIITATVRGIEPTTTCVRRVTRSRCGLLRQRLRCQSLPGCRLWYSQATIRDVLLRIYQLFAVTVLTFNSQRQHNFSEDTSAVTTFWANAYIIHVKSPKPKRRICLYWSTH